MKNTLVNLFIHIGTVSSFFPPSDGMNNLFVFSAIVLLLHLLDLPTIVLCYVLIKRHHSWNS